MDVLLVEDDELVRRTLAEGLAEAGLQVTDLPGSREALGLPNATAPPAVLVTDINLGSAMDGFGLALAARQRWPAICVVLISGRPQNINGYQLHRSDRFLAKPFVIDDLLWAIREAMSE